jgi:hypothetical protein
MLNILAAALLSGLVATWASILYYSRAQTRQAKMAVFQELLGTRHVLLPVPHEAATAAAFASAVNQIAIVFTRCGPVLNALKSFHEVIVEPSASADLKAKRLLELFKAMAKDLHVDSDILGENFFLQAFSVNPPVAQPDFQFQTIRWQDGQSVIVGLIRFGPTGPWVPLALSGEQAMLIGCTLTELAVLCRERKGQFGSSNASLEIATIGPEFMQRVERRRAASAGVPGVGGQIRP